MTVPSYLEHGDLQTRLDKFQIHYGGFAGYDRLPMTGQLVNCPSVGREARWGLSKSQIEKDYADGHVSESEFRWAEERGLLRKEYSLTS